MLYLTKDQIAIALAANIGGQASPISSPQNLISLGSMDPPLSWLQWFAISIPVSSLSVVLIWAFLHINYRWESDLEIPKMRKNTDPLTVTHYYVLAVSALTILLWCAEKSLEDWFGDMGVIAIVPLLAFFGTGILSKVRYLGYIRIDVNNFTMYRRISIRSTGPSSSWPWVVLPWVKLPFLPGCSICSIIFSNVSLKAWVFTLSSSSFPCWLW